MDQLKKSYRNIRMLGRKIEYEQNYKKQKAHSITDICSRNISYTLFVTNDNFGGTKQYEDNFTKENKNVIVLRRRSYGERPDLIFEVVNNDNGHSIWLHLNELDQLYELHYSTIIVNTLVHFSNTFLFLYKITQYKKENPECSLIYLVHDYNSVCINCNLFVKDHYCNLECQKEKCDLFLADKQIDINRWREKWKPFLLVCDEIRCFSESSKDILIQAYGEEISRAISVRPHDISFIKFTPIKEIEKKSLHIGIVGSCNADFKGRPLVRKIIQRYGDEIPISLIGSDYKYYHIKRKLVQYTGKYSHDDLQKIMERENISVAIFPSLCPETFSYLVSELIAMNIPIISLDIGAQGDKAKAYKKGIVVENERELWSVIDKMFSTDTWENFKNKYQNILSLS